MRLICCTPHRYGLKHQPQAVFLPLLLAASTTHPQGWGSDQNLGDCALKRKRQMTIAGWIPHQPGRSGVPGPGPWAERGCRTPAGCVGRTTRQRARIESSAGWTPLVICGRRSFGMKTIALTSFTGDWREIVEQVQQTGGAVAL